MAQTGKVRDVRPLPVKARYANVLGQSKTAVASSTEAVQQAQGPRMALPRLTASKTTHGRTTKAERAKAKQRAEVGRQVLRELKEIETWALDHGHLSKDWRDQFK